MKSQKAAYVEAAETAGEAAETFQNLRHLGRMVDWKNDVATDFYLEPAKTPGPRQNSELRHLVAVSSDGRPARAMTVPPGWSEDDLLLLVNGITRWR